MAWRLAQPDVPGDEGFKDSKLEVLAYFCYYLVSKIVAAIEHCEKYALNGQMRVEAELDFSNGVK